MSLAKPNRNNRHIYKKKRPYPSKYHASFNDAKPLPKNCNKKKKFKTSEDAQIMCDQLNERMAMQEVLAEVYYCRKHDVWHVGHDRQQKHKAPNLLNKIWEALRNKREDNDTERKTESKIEE